MITAFLRPLPGLISLSVAVVAMGPAPVLSADRGEVLPLLAGSELPGDPPRIRLAELPSVPCKHVLVSDARESGGFHGHNHLMRTPNGLWLMWSDGPGLENLAGQRVRLAFTADGVRWSEPGFLTPEPPVSGPASPHYGTHSPLGFRWLARGFWHREGELLGLASLDEAAELYGPSLQLRAFRLDPKTEDWHEAGIVRERAVCLSAPRRLPGGPWMTVVRPSTPEDARPRFLRGGAAALDAWTAVPVPASPRLGSANAALWWRSSDGNLLALFRSAEKSGALFRARSSDLGRTWSPPVRTNFPPVTALEGIRLSDGRFALLSLLETEDRDILLLSLSENGRVFSRMLRLLDDRELTDPALAEFGDHLFVAFSRGRQTVELLHVPREHLQQTPGRPSGDSPKMSR